MSLSQAHKRLRNKQELVQKQQSTAPGIEEGQDKGLKLSATAESLQTQILLHNSCSKDAVEPNS